MVLCTSLLGALVYLLLGASTASLNLSSFRQCGNRLGQPKPQEFRFASDIEFIAARRKVGDFEPEVDKLPQFEPPSKGPITRSNKKLCRT